VPGAAEIDDEIPRLGVGFVPNPFVIVNRARIVEHGLRAADFHLLVGVVGIGKRQRVPQRKGFEQALPGFGRHRLCKFDLHQ
jgi:hypothetical protein